MHSDPAIKQDAIVGVLSLALVLMVSAIAQSQQSPPTIDTFAPQKVAAYAGFRLVISGTGFQEGARVFVQGATRTGTGAVRYSKYTPAEVSNTQIIVDLKLGLGLYPGRREIFIRNPDGARSNAVVIQVVSKKQMRAERDENPPAGENTEEPAVAGEEEALSTPEIHEIQPAQVDAATHFNLLLIGSGFNEGAKVYVLANVNVATARQPKYEFVAFEADYLDESLLEIRFSRGFNITPRERTVYVSNPDGGESNRAVLIVNHILKRSP